MKILNPTIFLMTICMATSQVLAESQDQSERAREFVVMGYQGIRLDVESGKGPYLRTLFDLLETPVSSEGSTLVQLKTWVGAYPNIMDFADHVISLKSQVVATTDARPVGELVIPEGPGVYQGERLGRALEHLTRGMAITITLKTGEQIAGKFEDYSSQKLWIRGASRRFVPIDSILALRAPQL